MSTDTLPTVLTRSVPVPEEGVGLYTERIALYQVHNRLLRIGLAAAGLVIVSLCATGYYLSRSITDIKPLVVRVDSNGDVTTGTYESLRFQPREPEVRHFLMRFVQDHYGRVRATAHDAFQRKLHFMTSGMARAAMEEETRTKSLQALRSGADSEVEIVILNVAIEDLRQSPYKAAVSFEKVFRSEGRELKREKYTAQFQFTLMERIPNNFISVNPLGLVITYFREDQGF